MEDPGSGVHGGVQVQQRGPQDPADENDRDRRVGQGLWQQERLHRHRAARSAAHRRGAQALLHHDQEPGPVARAVAHAASPRERGLRRCQLNPHVFYTVKFSMYRSRSRCFCKLLWAFFKIRSEFLFSFR